MPARLSASGFARADACPASHALPCVSTPSGAGAERGTQAHAFYEAISAGVSREEALAQVADQRLRQMLAAVDLAEVPVGRAEVAYAYDPRTGQARELGGAGRRDYQRAAAHEIPGTVDLVALALPTHALVVDWSTDHDLDVPAKRAQVEVYQLMVARTHGLTQVLGAIGHHRHDGTLAWHRWSLDAWDLTEVAARVRRTVERVERARELVATGQTPDVTAGAHCRDCRAWLACPATAQAVALLRGDPPADPAALGRAYEAARAVERLAEHTRELARAAVERDGALPLGDGRRLICTEDTRGRKSLRAVRA